MGKITVGIIEDNPDDLAVLRGCLGRWAESRGAEPEIFSFEMGEAFLSDCRRKYDIVFMDMQLSGMDGFEASRRFRWLNPDAVLIFVTNLERYAIKGYEVSADDFILKPVKYPLFEAKMDRAVKKLITEETSVPVSVRTESGIKYIPTRDILYVEIMKHDMTYHTADGEVAAYGSLSRIRTALAAYGFAKCCSWCLVNLKYVEGLYGDDIKLWNGERLRISRRMRRTFMQALNAYCAEGRVK